MNPHIPAPTTLSLKEYQEMKKPGKKELSASDITKTALQLLAAQRITAWRQNNLTVRRRKGIVNKGVGDILGYTASGVFLACEVKKIGDVLSEDQKVFLAGVHKCGGIALIATQLGNHVQLLSFNEYIKK